MKDREIIVQKLKEVCSLLEQNLDASNMDVEFMQQKVESMIEEFEETGEFNQNELKLNFIKMNEESIESEIENELTEEDIQNAEDSQIIYESFSQDTDAQSKLVDEVENNNVSEADLLKNFNNNTKLC